MVGRQVADRVAVLVREHGRWRAGSQREIRSGSKQRSLEALGSGSGEAGRGTGSVRGARHRAVDDRMGGE